MFTERELLILSFAVDFVLIDDGGAFYSEAEKTALLDKIHNVLRATRQVEFDTIAKTLAAIHGV